MFYKVKKTDEQESKTITFTEVSGEGATSGQAVKMSFLSCWLGETKMKHKAGRATS